MKKNKVVLFIMLGALLTLLIVSSIYMDFIAKSSKGFTYILIGQMLVGILASLVTLFIGLKVFNNKKNYELLFIGFLEIMFVFGLVLLNYVYGYHNVVNSNNYIEYMEYVSMEFNLFIYLIFVFVIGLLTLNLFVANKINLINKKEKEA